MTPRIAFTLSLSALLLACNGTVVDLSAGGGSLAPVVPPPGAVADVPCACPADSIQWELDAQYVPVSQRWQVEGCAAITYVAQPIDGLRNPPKPVTCSQPLATCDSGAEVSIDALAQATGQPDVKAALEAAAKSGSEPFYGYDERPVDGWAIRLIVGNASIVVGSDCEDVPGCTPIPKGLAAMRDRLVAIGYAVYQSTACTEAAGGK